jgi:hypothetical protein
MRENKSKGKSVKASKTAKRAGSKRSSKQPSINIVQTSLHAAHMASLLASDSTPYAVRNFIEILADKLASKSGMTCEECAQAGVANTIANGAQRLGPDALSVVLSTALETLALHAPNLNPYGQDYTRRAIHYAAALSHPDTPKSFRDAFDAIYGDLLVSKTDWTHPSMIRRTYAAMRVYLDDDNYCGNAEGIDESLLRLMETLLPEHVQEEARQASSAQNGGQR